jgi:hypothetical protein
MAILDQIPGLEISIVVDGNDLLEYPDEDEDIQSLDLHSAESKTVRRFVESTSDKEFAILLKLVPPYIMDSESLIFKISIDGKRMTNQIITKSKKRSFFCGDIITGMVERLVEGATVQNRDKQVTYPIFVHWT